MFAYPSVQTVFNQNLESSHTFYFSEVDHVGKQPVHPVPTDGLYQHRNSVQIMVHMGDFFYYKL